VYLGYLSIFCRTLLEEIDHFPGDARTLIGFITYDSVLHFYGLDQEGSQQPQMFVVSDLEGL
jgi:protein transport protein SEC24